MQDPLQFHHSVSIDFLRTELETGVTFANLALNAQDLPKHERNRANARTAYDKFQEYASGIALSREETRELTELSSELKRLLLTLEESS